MPIFVSRRWERDINERGRTFDSVRDQYLKTVRPMHLQFVEPSRALRRHRHPRGLQPERSRHGDLDDPGCIEEIVISHQSSVISQKRDGSTPA